MSSSNCVMKLGLVVKSIRGHTVGNAHSGCALHQALLLLQLVRCDGLMLCCSVPLSQKSGAHSCDTHDSSLCLLMTILPDHFGLRGILQLHHVQHPDRKF